MFQILKKIFQQKFYRKIFILLNLIFILLYFFFINFFSAVQIFSVPIFTKAEQWNIFFHSIFDISILHNILMLILVIFFILSISLFFILFYILFNETKKINKSKSVWGLIGMFISILGLSCATCGIGLLASILSLFGLSGIVVYFPLHGLEIGYLGVIILNITNHILLKRIKNPFIC
jgi:uncharacterized BrkB/YihY/UPF0761 family membrane protein